MKKIRYFIIILFLVCICGCDNKDNGKNNTENNKNEYVSLSDRDFLINIGSFEKSDAPNVIWNFYDDGKGIISIDGEQTKYDMTWKLKDNKLVINVKWIYEEKKEYEIEFFKDNTKIVLDKEYEFVKKGSTKKSNVKLNKPSELKGGWNILQDNGNYMWYFDDDYCYVGYYVDKLYVVDKYFWGIVDGDLVLISVSLKKEKYGYIVSDDNLVIYRKNEVINTFNRYKDDVVINK